MALFCTLAATCQSFSALAHVYPDHHGLEKLDHIGILGLMFGTPYSELLAHIQFKDLDVDLSPLLCMVVLGLLAAFFPPAPRTISFGAAVVGMFCIYWDELISTSMVVQLGLYLIGAICFLRNGGHNRGMGLADHHILHYVVTAACSVHALHLWTLSSGAGQKAT
eukprot:evm.model.scf_2100.2 EVM.evm.TU.scf_2100.2   scf_2100:15679-17695(-)